MSLYDQVEELFDAGELDATYPPSVYEAYLKSREAGIDYLIDEPQGVADKIAIYYVGYYETRREFIEVYIEDILGVELPPTITPDYKVMWEADLRHYYDFVSEGGEAGWYFEQH